LVVVAVALILKSIILVLLILLLVDVQRERRISTDLIQSCITTRKLQRFSI